MAETEHKLPFTAEDIENRLKQITNNAQAIEQVRKEIPTTPDAVGARPATWMPTASEVGADKSGTAVEKVSKHNVSEESHSDIRLLINNLTTRLNIIANSEDVDLDQLGELVAYIKSNRSLIEEVTTNKVSVADIIDNLTTSVINKPLSAKQGVVLKGLIDAIVVPTLLSQLTGDATHRLVTDEEKAIWNNKANKATTLAGYGITDGATKQEVSQVKETIADLKDNGTGASKILKMATVHPIGKLFETEYDYSAWVHNNVKYDSSIDRIIVIFHSGSAHVTNDKIIQMAVINPRTFEVEKIKEIYNSSINGITAGVYGFVILEDGTYMLSSCYDTSSEYSKTVTLYKSVDKGETWVTVEPTINNLPSANLYYPFSLSLLSNGRLLLNERETRHILYSDNNGETWEAVKLSAYCLEPHFVELSDGKIICLARKTMYGTNNGAWNGTKQIEPAVYWISTDYGTTWEYKGDSKTITEMTASNCCSVVKDGYIDLFVCSRYPHGDKLGVIYHYYASEEDAFNDNWGTPKVVLYPNCKNPQDFSYIGCCTDSNDNIHICYYDGLVEGKTDIYYMIASQNPVAIPVNADLTNVISLPYSKSMVDELIAGVYTKLNAKINNIIIQGGGNLGGEGDEEVGSYFVTDGLYEWWDFLDESKYDADTSSYAGYRTGLNMVKNNPSDASDLTNGLLQGKFYTDISDAIKPSVGYTIELVEHVTGSVKNPGISLVRLNARNNDDYYINLTGNTAVFVKYVNTSGEQITCPTLSGTNYGGVGFVGNTIGFLHVVIVITNESLRSYVNGKLNFELPWKDAISDFTALVESFRGMYIVNQNDNTSLYTQGCRIYSKALSDDEVLNNYTYEKNLRV